MVPYLLLRKWAPSASQSNHRRSLGVSGGLPCSMVSIFASGDPVYTERVSVLWALRSHAQPVPLPTQLLLRLSHSWCLP